MNTREVFGSESDAIKEAKITPAVRMNRLRERIEKVDSLAKKVLKNNIAIALALAGAFLAGTGYERNGVQGIADLLKPGEQKNIVRVNDIDEEAEFDEEEAFETLEKGLAVLEKDPSTEARDRLVELSYSVEEDIQLMALKSLTAWENNSRQEEVKTAIQNNEPLVVAPDFIITAAYYNAVLVGRLNYMNDPIDPPSDDLIKLGSASEYALEMLKQRGEEGRKAIQEIQEDLAQKTRLVNQKLEGRVSSL